MAKISQTRIGRYEAAVSFFAHSLPKNQDLSALTENVTVSTIAHAFSRNLRDVAVDCWRNAGCPVLDPTRNDEASAKISQTPAHAFSEDTPIGAQ
jgi:hypothetical protein